jgi:hypothetical protein
LGVAFFAAVVFLAGVSVDSDSPSAVAAVFFAAAAFLAGAFSASC